MSASAIPRISYLATGGTIASTRVGDGAGAVPTLTAAELLTSIPQLADTAQIVPQQVSQLPSSSFTFATVEQILVAAKTAVQAGAAGVVVSQGTDTLEEVAFALDLLWDAPEPLVVTGAMRNPSLPGSDGPANLLAAIQTAADHQAVGLGVLVVLNEQIHAARFAHKDHTFAASTFISPGAGPVGWVAEGVPQIRLLPPRRPALAARLDEAPPVALIRLGMGDDGRLLPMLPRLDYRGAIIEALGGGHVPATLMPALRDLARQMPVVLGSRAGSGEVLSSTYGFPGSETELLAAGLISAGALDGLKARVLLTALLSTQSSRVEVSNAFRLYGLAAHALPLPLS